MNNDNKPVIQAAIRAAGYRIELADLELILRLIEAVNDNPEGMTLKDVSRISHEVKAEYDKEPES